MFDIITGGLEGNVDSPSEIVLDVKFDVAKNGKKPKEEIMYFS